MKKVSFTLILLFVLAITSYSQENVRDVTILHWNDFHARNMPYEVTKKVDGEEIEYLVGGTSGMLGYLKKYRDSTSLVVNGGDDYQGTPISSITKGRSQIQLLNLYNLDAVVLGNHEFDYGQYVLDSALQDANFDYLSANVYFEPEGTTMGKPYVIKEVNGVKIGIIGLTAFELPELIVPKNLNASRMLDADSVTLAGITALKEAECDMIMLLTHIGEDVDKKMAEKFYADVDVIVGGHSHTPLHKPVVQNGVVIVQAGSLGRYLGKLDLKIDTENDTVLFYSGELIETVMDSAINDAAAQLEVEKMMADINDELSEVLGSLEEPWERQAVRESNLGQWEAEVFRKTAEADIGFMNSGGLRADLPAGDITVNDIWTINPFGNTIVTMEVSGKVLKEMLTNTIRKNYLEMKEGTRPDIPITSGLEVEFDSEKIMAGEEEIIVSVIVNGEALDETRNYTIATNNYVGEQFDKFFGTVSVRPPLKDTNIIDRDALIEAVRMQKIINNKREYRINDISKRKE